MSSVLLSERTQGKYFIPRFDREIPRAYNAGVRSKRRTLCDTENREVFGKMMLTDSPVFAVCMMLAGLAVCTAWYALRLKKEGLPVSAALMPALVNGLIVGFEIDFFIVGQGSFHLDDFILQGGCVALGELAVLFVLGLPLSRLLELRGIDKKYLQIK